MMKIKDPDFDYRYNILKNKLNIKDELVLKQAESDIVTTRIAEVFKDMYFEPTSSYLKNLHKKLFSDVYYFAGKYRTIHIEKSERILQGLSVEYSESDKIEKEVEEVFESIKKINFEELSHEEKVDFITNTLVSLWKTHPFREGNTRTCLVFLRTYLHSLGIDFSANLFKSENNYKYTRDALVAASFEAEDLNVKRNFIYIKKLISDIMVADLEKKRGI